MHFQVQYVTSAPYRATEGVHYGPLSIRAINQHPDFFKDRPGPTVSLRVTRAGPNQREALPVRVFSSGGGYSEGVHYLSVSIDILEPETIRRKRLGQFASQMSEAARRFGFPTSALKSGGDPARPSPYDEMYISNPVGVYLLTATFQPDPADFQRRLTASVYIRVLDGLDSLDLFLQKLSEKK